MILTSPAPERPVVTDKPSVLFVCVHNAGRSQMAAAYLAHLSGGAVEVRSAGSAPARWRSQPAAIWERPALWMQTNRTLGLFTR